MTSAFLNNLVTYMQANGEQSAVIEADGQPVQIELRPAPVQPKSCDCISCRLRHVAPQRGRLHLN